mgnify:CR=1 FL=1
MDAKINNVLNLCHDQAILNAVQCIIQNMIACEDASQQQLSYLQSKYNITSTASIFRGGDGRGWEGDQEWGCTKESPAQSSTL